MYLIVYIRIFTVTSLSKFVYLRLLRIFQAPIEPSDSNSVYIFICSDT